jgi:hypothetical protein
MEIGERHQDIFAIEAIQKYLDLKIEKLNLPSLLYLAQYLIYFGAMVFLPFYKEEWTPWMTMIFVIY